MSKEISDRDQAVAIKTLRLAAKIDLLPTDCQMATETAAFDVVVDGMGLIGRWAQVNGTDGSVTWTDGSSFETGGCDGDPVRIVAAIRKSVPVPPTDEPRGGARGWLGR